MSYFVPTWEERTLPESERVKQAYVSGVVRKVRKGEYFIHHGYAKKMRAASSIKDHPIAAVTVKGDMIQNIDHFNFVLCRARATGKSYWFDEHRNASYNSQNPLNMYRAFDGSYWWLSSEQHFDEPRRWTVRIMSNDGDVETIGPYNELSEYCAYELLERCYNKMQTFSYWAEHGSNVESGSCVGCV